MAAAASRGVDVCFRLTDRMQVSDLERDRALLDAIESERRDRFVFDADRRDYAAAHALLRRMLCDQYGTDPTAWRFDAAPSGKPQIAGGFPDHRIDFSLSHTRGAVACAIADAAAIGVDVERIDRSGDVADLARRFFSPAEARAVAAEASPRRRVRFIEFWTLKEAYVKALGAGLSHPLASFGFEFEPGTTLRFDDHSGPADA
jgi:4'-phosphopantetheinyl transferase